MPDARHLETNNSFQVKKSIFTLLLPSLRRLINLRRPKFESLRSIWSIESIGRCKVLKQILDMYISCSQKGFAGFHAQQLVLNDGANLLKIKEYISDLVN